jgi:NAD(P)-dependent dehydrogenase (short-subunit alcohol dehydrogenase family)
VTDGDGHRGLAKKSSSADEFQPPAGFTNEAGANEEPDQLNQQETNVTIANRTILITGANRGIGRALVDEALRRGAKRVYAGTRGAALQVADERVTQLALDVTNATQIQHAVEQVGTLDVLINNAGVAIYDDPSNLDTIEQHLAVNLFGIVKVTRAFLPLLKRSKGAIINNLSLAALAPLPVIPGYSMSKAAALNMTHSLRALLASQGVSVHAVMLGPIDTDMNRGFDIPKATPATAAKGIFDGLEKGEEEIFPDPASQSIAEGWRAGIAKALERQFAAFVPATAADVTAAA